MKNIKSFSIIALFGTILMILLVGFSDMYGNYRDWYDQHTVFPDYFRQTFYETGKFLPKLAVDLGAGQNIFNFGYYGLMSPIILLSFLFPFIPMKIYIMAISFILYLCSGFLMFLFLKSKFTHKISLLASCIFVSLAPITFHFHCHIMFVWYIPFLILALMGVDRYVEKKKSALLILSIFLIILINYYYAVSAVVVVVLYGFYKLLENFENIKSFIPSVLKATVPVIIGVLLGCFILLPNLYAVLHTQRIINLKVYAVDLLFFTISTHMYGSYTCGITFIFLLALFGNLLFKNKTKSDVFLNISLLVILFVPVICYSLNGFLYVRGKALIPFTVLFMLILTQFLTRIKEKEIPLKKLITVSSIISAVIIAINLAVGFYKNTDLRLIYVFIVDAIITLLCFMWVSKKNKTKILIIPLCICILSSVGSKVEEIPVTYKEYQKHLADNSTIQSLLDGIEDDSYYRIDVDYTTKDNINNTFGKYTATTYSSSFNTPYNVFYNEKIGNNITYRNSVITSGTNNPIFHNLMGIKYIVSTKENLPFDLIEQKGEFYLYKNETALPLVYIPSKIGSSDTFDKLPFPQSLEYIHTNTLVKTDAEHLDESRLEKLDLGLEESYSLYFEEQSSFVYSLPEVLNFENKLLIISFKMGNTEQGSNIDKAVSINGIKNMLTAKKWMYHNRNHSFEYVLNPAKELTVTFTKGYYDISEINVHLMDKSSYNATEINNLKIDKANSVISGNVALEDDNYIITSLPFDEGYTAYIDGKQVETQIVNSAFLGFKVSKGSHNIKIIYNSPWLRLGAIISALALLGFILIICMENKKINELYKKYKEIIMYLIFGVLTTVVSLSSYFILANTLFNANNAFQLQICNILSWIAAVTFAYFTNKHFVFNKKGNSIKEFVNFYLSRVFTLLVDMLIMFVFVSLLSFNDTIVKFAVQIIIVIFNYILSKFLVFRGDVKK